LKERCKIFSLVPEDKMTGRLVKQARIAIALAKFVIQMPVFGVAPNSPFGDPQQDRHPERKRLGDPLSEEKSL
jgi:hypothetical protein